jgi:hypothetical protein
MTTTLIEKYTIKYLSGTSPRSILLKSNLENIGTLFFHPDSGTLPPDRVTNSHIILHYHVRDFENVLYILKHEKPAYLSFSDPGTENTNGIITGDAEPAAQVLARSNKSKNKAK